jgi:hypothetical protein
VRYAPLLLPLLLTAEMESLIFVAGEPPEGA